MSKIEIKNVYKIFGDQPSKVLPMVQEGATKEDPKTTTLDASKPITLDFLTNPDKE